MSGVLLGAVLALAPAAAAQATVRYAAPNGTGTTCSQPAPCDVVTAVDASAANDEVIVTPGDYGSPGAPITSELRVDGDFYVHGEAGQPTPTLYLAAPGGQHGLFLTHPGAHVADLRVEYAGTGAGLFVNTSGGLAERVLVHSSGTGQFAAACAPFGGQIRNSVCWASGAGAPGVGMSSGGAQGITVILRNVTAVGSAAGASGISVATTGGASDTVTGTSVIARGDGPDVKTQTDSSSQANVIFDHSNFAERADAGNGFTTAPGAGSNQTSEPRFMNAALGDFHQAGDSPTIDKGASVSLSADPQDIDRESRFARGGPDIGADEIKAARFASPTGSGSACTSQAPCALADAVDNAGPYEEVILATGTYSPPPGAQDVFFDRPLHLHGAAGQPRPVIQSGSVTGVQVAHPSARVNDLAIEHSGSDAGLRLEAGTAERLSVRSSATNGTGACTATGGLLRDTVCWATGDGRPGFGYVAFGAGTDTVSLRNVTAVAAGSGASGLGASATSGRQTSLSATNVIARGVSEDVAATSDTGNGSSLTLVFDHSNYASVSSTNATVTAAGAGGGQTAAPLFTDAAAGDFHEGAGSPTINAGVNAEANGPLDFEGTARSLGAATDIGADEVVPAAAPGPGPGGGGTGGKGGGSKGGTTPVKDVKSPLMRTFSLNPSAFLASTTGGSLAQRKRSVGTTVSYRLDEAATVAFRVERRAAGRRVGRRCRKPTRRNRKRRRCTRYVRVRGGFTHRGKAGRNTFRFTGRIRRRALRPGRYRLVGVPTDAAGNRGKRVARRFRILRP